MSLMITKNANKVDNFLKKYFRSQKSTNLIKPMKYGTLFGGKKIRTTIIINSAKIFNLDMKKIINVCAAVECIHSYSLIHDDLPCMDNDKLRRGKPAAHVKFGESTAILAGNSLLTLAFEIITEKKYFIKPDTKLILLKHLAACSGHTGIAGGQYLDLSYEKRGVSMKKVIDMQKKKTGKLFEFCCLAPAVIAGKNNKIKNDMSSIGEELGFLFQIADDLLDLKGKRGRVGKPVKKDKRKGKSNIVSLLGYEKTLQFAFGHRKMIIDKLKKYGSKSKDFINTVNFILDRSY